MHLNLLANMGSLAIVWWHGIYLFYIHCNKEIKLFYFKIFQHNLKASLCPLWRTWKKPFDSIYYLYKQSSLISCYAWQRIAIIGPGKSCHCQTWLKLALSRNEILQRKQNWTTKSSDLKENAGQVNSVFVIRAALWAEKLGPCLEYCRSWKIC